MGKTGKEKRSELGTTARERERERDLAGITGRVLISACHTRKPIKWCAEIEGRRRAEVDERQAVAAAAAAVVRCNRAAH